MTFDNLDQLTSRVAVAFLDLLPRSSRPNNLPFVSLGPLFKGRNKLLLKSKSQFDKTKDAAAIVGKQAIHGLGGIGKTQVADEYAWKYADNYSALLFVIAAKPDELNRNIAGLAAVVGIQDARTDVTDEQLLRGVLKWFQGNDGWLLIRDNVDDRASALAIKSLLPRLGRGHVLITSRFRILAPDVKRFDLEALPLEVSIAFLNKRTDEGRRIEQSDSKSVDAIARKLDGLPLALEQAASFILANHTSRMQRI